MTDPTENGRAAERWRSLRLPDVGPESGGGLKPLPDLIPGPAFVDLFERAPVGYLVLNHAGLIERINHTGAAILGWDAEWLVGKPFARWIATRDRKAFHEHRRRLDNSHAAIGQEIRVKNRQGRFVGLRLESVQDESAAGRCRMIMIDISGEQRSARRARRLQSQLTHMTRVHTAGEFASSLAHELNQPLGTVVLNCEAAMRMLKSDVIDKDECVDALSQARSAATYASEVIRHLRRFLKKNGELYRDCKLRNMICDVIALIDTDARDNDVELQLDIERNLPAVHADPVQIEQVLVNLTHNSVEAVSEAEASGIKRVVIRARRAPPEQILVAVEDTGPGLSGKQIDRIFSPFYTTKQGGMGMGLSISRSIIEAHGGELWADRDAASGACFLFTLPAAGSRKHDD